MSLKKIILLFFILIIVIAGFVLYKAYVPQRVSLSFVNEILEDRQYYWSGPNNEYLTRYREEFDLLEIISGAENDFEKVIKLNSWVSGLWKHHGSNTPEFNDPISILKEVEMGKRFRCVEYAIVLTEALNAVGIPARTVSLMTKDVETKKTGAGHVITEVYVRDFEKWVMVDGQWNAIPLLDGIPLNSVELQEAINSNFSSVEIMNMNFFKQLFYKNWIYSYLYYFNFFYNNVYSSYNNSRKLLLAPIGAANPKVFQIKYPIQNMDYTNSISEFFPNPYDYMID